MRKLLFVLMLAPFASLAQDPVQFARVLQSGKVKKLDRWMKRELHLRREGHQVPTSQGTYTSHGPTYDSLVAFMRVQPGVEDAAWDKCIGKLDLWPGHSNIGLRWRVNGMVVERCWGVREGRPGTIDLFGWRPKVRRSKQVLVFRKAFPCPGFVEEQRQFCAQMGQ